MNCFRFYSSKEANVVGGRAVMEAPPPMEEEVEYIYSLMECIICSLNFRV